MHVVAKLSMEQNDKIMAALAHMSTLLSFMRVITPIINWTTQGAIFVAERYDH
jgi:hypothetical protein